MKVTNQAFAGTLFLFTLITGPAIQAGTTATATPHDTFQPVGNMTTARAHPIATLLNDGSVLVTGGWKRSGPNFSGSDLVSQAAAERFDPASNTFSAVGSMAHPRASHTAVRLQDGRVLVVGGSDDQQAQIATGDLIATAEVYAPATGQFASAGDLINPRINPTATLLTNGKVLVVGGWNTDTVDAAELYDPTTGQFSPAGAMVTGRNHNAAVALPDGRVAILGGYHHSDGPQASVEIYDPSTDRFSPAGQLVEARAEFQATLLPDGRIEVNGGVGGPSDGQGGGTTVLSSVEIYDPATGQSTVTDQMADARFAQGAAALSDGRVLVVGGQHSSNPNDPDLNPSAAVLIDPANGKVSASMARSNAIVVPALTLLPDGRVLVLDGRPRKLTAEVYVP